MSLWTFTAKPQRAPMLAEPCGLCRVNAFCHVYLLHASLGPQRSQNALRSEGGLTQPHSHSVVDGVRDRGNRGRQRSLPGFLRTEWPLGIDALDDDAFNFGRLH